MRSGVLEPWNPGCYFESMDALSGLFSRKVGRLYPRFMLHALVFWLYDWAMDYYESRSLSGLTTPPGYELHVPESALHCIHRFACQFLAEHWGASWQPGRCIHMHHSSPSCSVERGSYCAFVFVYVLSSFVLQGICMGFAAITWLVAYHRVQRNVPIFHHGFCFLGRCWKGFVR